MFGLVEWSRGESNPLEIGVLNTIGGCDAQGDAQDWDSDRQVLTQIVERWPTLEEWRKRAIVEIAQSATVSRP